MYELLDTASKLEWYINDSCQLRFKCAGGDNYIFYTTPTIRLAEMYALPFSNGVKGEKVKLGKDYEQLNTQETT